MKFGKVIGNVVSTVKLESLEGIKLMLVQPLDENYIEVGDAIIAADTIQAGVGDYIYYETSREAGQAIETHSNPCDAAIMGIIDIVNLEGRI